MMRTRSRGFFARVLLRSLRHRWSRLLIAALATLLGALLVAALSTLTLDIGNKVGKELRAYGANIIVSPRAGALAVGSGGMDFGRVSAGPALAEADLAALGDPGLAPYLSGYVPYLHGIVEAGGRPVILAGTQLDRVPLVSPWWSVAGDWLGPEDQRGAMIGRNVARQLGLEVGGTLTVEYQGQSRQLIVSGIVDTGAAEDSQIFVNLRVAQELLGRIGVVGLVQVSAISASRPLADTASAIERLLPGSQAKIIGQIADAEAAVFRKIQLLMAIVAGLVLVTAALSVTSTMTTTILERTREIGLLKALGAADASITALFLAEALAIGICGGILGYAFGLLAAQLIASSVFQAAVAWHWQALPATVGVAIAVAILASIIPLRRVVAIEPSATLRGD